MSNPMPTQEAYDSLIYKLASLETELGQARKLLEAPAKWLTWWKRLWGRGSKVVALTMVVTVLILPNNSLAVSDLAQILKGLPGVRVDVSYNINTQDRRWNDVTKEQIQTEVELRLRRAGIMVIKDREEGKPCLEITFWMSEMQPKYYFFMVGAGLMEEIITARKIQVNGKLINNTWETSKATYTWRGNIKTKDALDIIDNIVDQFINDYLAVNPKTNPVSGHK